jgi:hypothetical protein
LSYRITRQNIDPAGEEVSSGFVNFLSSIPGSELEQITSFHRLSWCSETIALHTLTDLSNRLADKRLPTSSHHQFQPRVR